MQDGVKQREHDERRRHHERAIARESGRVEHEQRRIEYRGHRGRERAGSPNEFDRFAKKIGEPERQQQFVQRALRAHVTQR
jgi:hypothetical protein